MGEQYPMGCHCLCSKNHPGLTGVCRGINEVGLWWSHTDVPLGVVNVPFCYACASATAAEAAEAKA